jgi:predicted TPR repeat methyltransferase
LENAGDYADAIAQMGKAVDLLPGYQAAVDRLGVLLTAHATPQAAIDYYTRQLALHPDWNDGWFDLGTLHRNHGDLTEARIDFTMVMQLVPGTPQADAARGELAGIGQR